MDTIIIWLKSRSGLIHSHRSSIINHDYYVCHILLRWQEVVGMGLLTATVQYVDIYISRMWTFLFNFTFLLILNVDNIILENTYVEVFLLAWSPVFSVLSPWNLSISPALPSLFHPFSLFPHILTWSDPTIPQVKLIVCHRYSLSGMPKHNLPLENVRPMPHASWSPRWLWWTVWPHENLGCFWSIWRHTHQQLP